MNVKLTLSLEQEIIEQAKVVARLQHKSLSKLVENYLRQLAHSYEPQEIDITPLVAELSGLVSAERADRRKEDYTDYLTEKYR